MYIEKIVYTDESGTEMISKVIHNGNLHAESDGSRDRAFWMKKPPKERIAAVETLRRQYHGNTGRLRRTVQIFKQS